MLGYWEVGASKSATDILSISRDPTPLPSTAADASPWARVIWRCEIFRDFWNLLSGPSKTARPSKQLLR